MSGELLELKLSDSHTTFHTPGSDITGEVCLNLITPQPSYKRILIILTGAIEVYFTIPPASSGAANAQYFRETQTFINQQATLWDSSVKPLNKSGRHVLPFSFKLISDSSTLPSSIETRDGKIRYTVQAKLIGGVDNEIEITTVYQRVKVRANVDINRTDLISSSSATTEATAGCMCLGRDIITVTATLQRTGYCIVIDSIPVDVQVTPGRSRQVNYLSASLIQRVTCRAQNQPSTCYRVIATETNTQVPGKGVSFNWAVPPLPVKDTLELSLTDCSIIQLTYFIRVEYRASFMTTQYVDIPVVIGNVPLSSRGLMTTTSQGHVPVLSPPEEEGHEGYHPPSVPTSSSYQHEDNDDDEQSPLIKQ
jgi:hypothetical protein